MSLNLENYQPVARTEIKIAPVESASEVKIEDQTEAETLLATSKRRELLKQIKEIMHQVNFNQLLEWDDDLADEEVENQAVAIEAENQIKGGVDRDLNPSSLITNQDNILDYQPDSNLDVETETNTTHSSTEQTELISPTQLTSVSEKMPDRTVSALLSDEDLLDRKDENDNLISMTEKIDQVVPSIVDEEQAVTSLAQELAPEDTIEQELARYKKDQLIDPDSIIDIPVPDFAKQIEAQPLIRKKLDADEIQVELSPLRKLETKLEERLARLEAGEESDEIEKASLEIKDKNLEQTSDELIKQERAESEESDSSNMVQEASTTAAEAKAEIMSETEKELKQIPDQLIPSTSDELIKTDLSGQDVEFSLSDKAEDQQLVSEQISDKTEEVLEKTDLVGVAKSEDASEFKTIVSDQVDESSSDFDAESVTGLDFEFTDVVSTQEQDSSLEAKPELEKEIELSSQKQKQESTTLPESDLPPLQDLESSLSTTKKLEEFDSTKEGAEQVEKSKSSTDQIEFNGSSVDVSATKMKAEGETVELDQKTDQDKVLEATSSVDKAQETVISSEQEEEQVSSSEADLPPPQELELPVNLGEKERETNEVEALEAPVETAKLLEEKEQDEKEDQNLDFKEKDNLIWQATQQQQILQKLEKLKRVNQDLLRKMV